MLRYALWFRAMTQDLWLACGMMAISFFLIRIAFFTLCALDVGRVDGIGGYPKPDDVRHCAYANITYAIVFMHSLVLNLWIVGTITNYVIDFIGNHSKRGKYVEQG